MEPTVDTTSTTMNNSDYKPKYLVQFEFAVNIDTYDKNHVVKRDYPHAKKYFGLYKNRMYIVPSIKYLLTPILRRGLGMKDNTFNLTWVTKMEQNSTKPTIIGHIFLDPSDPIRYKATSLMIQHMESFQRCSHRLLFPATQNYISEHVLLSVEMRKNKDLQTPEIEAEMKALLDGEMNDYVQYFEPTGISQIYIADERTEKQLRDQIRIRRLRDMYDISDICTDEEVEFFVRLNKYKDTNDEEAMKMRPPPTKKPKITE